MALPQEINRMMAVYHTGKDPFDSATITEAIGRDVLDTLDRREDHRHGMRVEDTEGTTHTLRRGDVVSIRPAQDPPGTLVFHGPEGQQLFKATAAAARRGARSIGTRPPLHLVPPVEK